MVAYAYRHVQHHALVKDNSQISKVFRFLHDAEKKYEILDNYTHWSTFSLYFIQA